MTPSDSCAIIVSNDTGAVSYDFTLRGDPVPQRFDVTTNIAVSDGIPRAGAGNIEQAGSIDLCERMETHPQHALAHFRDRTGVEVDLVVERNDGSVIAVEVKSAAAVNRSDGKGLRFLRDRLGERLVAGVVFHTGPLTVQLDDRIWATPVSALWGGTGLPSDQNGQTRSIQPTSYSRNAPTTGIAARRHMWYSS